MCILSISFQNFTNIFEKLYSLLATMCVIIRLLTTWEGKNMLKLNSVSYSKTKKSGNLVNNVTLEVREADYIVISGQNDAERRALLEIIGAVISPIMGEVYIDGIELSKHTANQLTILRRGTFGYFLSDSELNAELSVAENVQLPLVFAGLGVEEINQRLERVLNIVGLIGFKEIKVANLTEWQRNKVLIARAIIGEPKVLILDEPCRVQDEGRLNEVLGLLSAVNRDGVCVVVASNNDAYFKASKRRVEISNGAIVEIKKERAPRETGKKTKTKKTTKTKTAKEKVVSLEEKPKKEEVRTVVLEEKPKKVVKAKVAEPEIKKVKVEEVKPEESKTKKSAGRPKKVTEEVIQVEPNKDQPKKAGRPKKQVEGNNPEPAKATRKKKEVE